MSSRTTVGVGVGLAVLCGCNLLLNLGQFDGATLATGDDSGSFTDATDGSLWDQESSAPQDGSTTDGHPLDGTTSDVGDAGAWDGGDSFVDGTADTTGDSSLDSTIDTSEEAGEAGVDGASDAAADVLDGGADGTADVADAGALDASDSGSDVLDGGADTSPGEEWCTANTTDATVLCRDFDDGRPYGAGFATQSSSFAVFPSVTLADFYSPPSSLLVPIPDLTGADGGPTSGDTQLNVHVLQPHTVIDVQAAMKLVNYSLGGGANVSAWRIAFESGSYWVSWDLRSATTGLDEVIVSDAGVQSFLNHVGMFPPLNQWFNVDLRVDFGASTAKLTINGNTSAIATIANPTPTGNSFWVTVGVNWASGPMSALQIYYDNIRVDVQ